MYKYILKDIDNPIDLKLAKARLKLYKDLYKELVNQYLMDAVVVVSEFDMVVFNYVSNAINYLKIVIDKLEELINEKR